MSAAYIRRAGNCVRGFGVGCLGAVMLPVMTEIQIENGRQKIWGRRPCGTYHTRGLGPGDEVEIEYAWPEPFAVIQLSIVIEEVEDHGERTIVYFRDTKTGQHGRAEVFRKGPPNWGIVKFQVVRKVWHQPQPHREIFFTPGGVFVP